MAKIIKDKPAPFWVQWLSLVAMALFIAFGIAMVLLQAPIRQLFGLIAYGSATAIEQFGEQAVAYVNLLHAIMGSLMAGFGLMLLFVIRGEFQQGSRRAWQGIALAISLWFLLDTGFSLWSGFWQNAVLNLGFMLAVGIPLMATRASFFSADRQ